MGIRAKPVTAVVTTFHPGPSLKRVVGSIHDQVDRVVIVDDGSSSDFDAVLEDLQEPAVKVIRLEENMGIATALNIGCRAAVGGDDGLIITLDQDSEPDQDFVDAMVATLDRARSAGLDVGMVVPEFFAGQSQRGRTIEGDLALATPPIQSGALFSKSTFARVGGFREDLFIDLVDVEFWLRLTERGIITIVAPGLRLAHQLGTTHQLTIFGRPVHVRGHAVRVGVSAPFRYYYRVRNRMVVDRRYRHVAPDVLTVEYRRDLKHFLTVLAIAHPHSAMMALMWRARRDARNGTLGRMPAELEAKARRIRWTPSDDVPDPPE